MFKIVSCGWNCKDFIVQTLASIEMQTVQNFEVMISYEGDDGGDAIIQQWCDDRGPNWMYDINYGEYRYDTRNRHDAMSALDPRDNDVIVTLDLDGDRFAHPRVLEHLTDYYADGTLLTYGSYEPDPAAPGCPPAIAFPPEVIAANSYRSFVAAGNPCSFNHLRTMKGKVFNAIPLDQFQWSDGRGWYNRGCDFQFTISGLELAGGRHKFITEVLMYYNSINPNSAWRIAPAESDDCNMDFLHRKSPLAPLP